MQDSNAPAKIVLPWAASASPPYIHTLPVASQIGVTAGAASWTDGFPPLTFVQIDAGGAGPFGEDMNAVLLAVSAGVRWLQAGGPVTWDGTYSTAIGGYPAGAIVQSATTIGSLWLCLVDNNTSNPDTGGAGWRQFLAGTLLANGEAYFKYVSSGQVRLLPQNGRNIVVHGVQYQLPAAGIAAANTNVMVDGVANSNLIAATGYLVSFNGTRLAFWNTGTYSHDIDTTPGNEGIEVVKQGSTFLSNESLVGFTQTDGSANFQIQGAGTLSWFNRKTVVVSKGVVGAFNITAVSPASAEITSTFRTTFVAWSDDLVAIDVSAEASNNTGGHGFGLLITIDTAPLGFNSSGVSPTANVAMGCTAIDRGTVVEGSHTVSVNGFVGPSDSGTTATFGAMGLYVTTRG